MAFPNNEIVEIKVLYRVNDQVCMNVLHYQAVGSTAGGTPFELTEGLLDDFIAITGSSVLDTMQDMMSNQANIFDITGQGVWPTRFAVQHRAVDIDGENVNPVNAQNLAATIEKSGELGNRHNIGSFHLGGLPPGHFAAGELQAGSLGQLQSIADALKLHLVDGASTADWVPVILNKSPIPNTDPVRYEISGGTPISRTFAQSSARVMRRRTKGIGI